MNEIKKIAVSMLDPKVPFCYRYSLEDAMLQGSIKRHGILMPVFVIHAKHPKVITGHRRVAAAKAFKLKTLPAIFLKGSAPQDAFFFNLISNWRQKVSEMDRARALGMCAGKLRFKEKDILELVMPLLDLPGEKNLLEFYLKADRLPESLKNLVEDGTLSFRGIPALLKFSKEDQDYFAEAIGSKVKLTSSQLLQAGEWLADLMKGTGKSLKALLQGHPAFKHLDHRDMDLRTKADKFFNAVSGLRFPGYSKHLERFSRHSAEILRGQKSFRLEPVEGFEEKGFELHARVKTPKDLAELLQKLADRHSALNSLFDVML